MNTQKPLVHLDVAGIVEVTPHPGINRDSQITIDLKLWQTPGGFAVCLDATHGYVRMMQQHHIRSLQQIAGWLVSQTSPLSRGLMLSGDGMLQVGDLLKQLTNSLVSWGASSKVKSPDIGRLPPAFFFDEGHLQANTAVHLQLGNTRREVTLGIGLQTTPNGYRARIIGTMELQRTMLEVTMGHPSALRRWIADASTQLAGAMAIIGFGERLFDSAMRSSFLPALSRLDNDKTQPLTGAVNVVRATVGLPKLDPSKPIPLVELTAEERASWKVFNTGAYYAPTNPDIHVFPDNVINR